MRVIDSGIRYFVVSVPIRIEAFGYVRVHRRYGFQRCIAYGVDAKVAGWWRWCGIHRRLHPAGYDVLYGLDSGSDGVAGARLQPSEKLIQDAGPDRSRITTVTDVVQVERQPATLPLGLGNCVLQILKRPGCVDVVGGAGRVQVCRWHRLSGGALD